MPEKISKNPVRSKAISRNNTSVEPARYGINKNQLGSLPNPSDERIPPTKNTEPARKIMYAIISLCRDSSAFSCK